MPYPIKNTTAQQTNTVRTLNFAFGVNQGGYGLTSSTAFWNGRPPNVSGYTAYVGNGTISPTMYMFQNDTNVIQFATNLGCGYCTTIELSLFYILNSGTAICLNAEPPNIVTNGLVVYLDAGFTPSYPKGLNAWYDTSQNLNNGTLTNGPTYNSADGGSLVFDGIDDKVVLPHILNYNLTNLTALVWIKPTSPYTGSFRNIISKEGADRDWNFYLYSSASNGVVDYYHFSTSRASSYVSLVSIPGGSLSLDVWHQCGFSISNGVLTYYLDGNVIGGSGINFSSANSSYPISIGGADNYTKGNIMTSQVYNRGLTNQEVLQNYYAGLERLIPKGNDLVLWLDGENTNTRVITPTTAYDRSNNNLNGSLENGVTLSHRDGGTTFLFDGIDDRIVTSLNGLNPSTTWTVWVKRTQSMGLYNMIMGMWLPYFSSMSDGSIHFSNDIGGIQRSLYAYVGLTDNIWYNITFVSSFNAGNTTMIIYLNGVLQTQATYAGQQPTTTSNSFRLGGWENGNSWQFKGKIGGVRIHKRALTQTEITTIYNADRTRYGV